MRGMGGSMPRAIRTHIVRNTIGTVIVNATFQVADAVLYVAYLSFLGLGAQPPATDWEPCSPTASRTSTRATGG